MSQLYHRIRDQAVLRFNEKKAQENVQRQHQDPNMSMYGGIRSSSATAAAGGGSRQKFRELLEIQQKADIILDEYLTDKSYFDYKKVSIFHSHIFFQC